VSVEKLRENKHATFSNFQNENTRHISVGNTLGYCLYNNLVIKAINKVGLSYQEKNLNRALNKMVLSVGCSQCRRSYRDAGDASSKPRNFFGQNWYIWAKFGKILAKFGQE